MSRAAGAMARSVARFLGLLFLASVGAPELAAATDSIPLGLARSYFEQAERIGAADGGSLWGVRLDGPMVLVDPESRQTVANRADLEGHLRERDSVYVGGWPESRNIANTAIEWAGVRWTMLVWPLPESKYERGRLLAHEMFHRIQPELGPVPNEASNEHLDTRDGRVWLRLELRALVEALIRTGGERAEALADALAFRARRYERFPEAAAQERALEANEGLAEYTGFKLSGLPEHVIADRVGVALEGFDHRTSYVRSFAYATGPAYGILLDEAGASWRRDALGGARLDELAADAYGIAPDELAARDPERRLERYGGARVIEQEDRRGQRRLARRGELRAKFVEGPTLALRPGASFAYSFDPRGVETFEGVGAVYPSARITDVWGVLEVEHGGVLMVRSGEGIVRVVVPLPEAAEEPPMNGDGWTLELAPGWRVEPGTQSGDWVVSRVTGGGDG